MIRQIIVITLLAALAACASQDKKDYDASANCQIMGYVPGNAEYDKCVRDEHAAMLLDRQRQEYEMMKQEQQDQTMRRY